jgi:UDP-glucose:glycoprotein glucosyltransferase
MPRFKKFHKTISKTAREGKTSYRLRHVPSVWAVMKPHVVVNGYGVELQLKRTDYIVIDDRQAEQGEKVVNQKPLGTGLDSDEDVSDLKPLSKDDVPDLSLNTASFVMESDQPMDTLLKLVQDFPKYTSIIAGRNTSADFLAEHDSNRDLLLAPGANVIWINGVQIPAREVNPHALLAHMRRERKLINGVRSQGLSASDAISLLSHPAITEGQTGNDAQRYDFRDATEGGNIIIWMNNIEKDSRYESWPTELRAVSSHSVQIAQPILTTLIVIAEDVPWSTAFRAPRHPQRHSANRFYFHGSRFEGCRNGTESHQTWYSVAMGSGASDTNSCFY